MVHYSHKQLDQTFAALSDATRRGVLVQLGRGDTSITQLAEQFHMSLTGMKKHVGVLERAGLVETAKSGRVRTCKLGPSRLETEWAWLESYRQLWDRRFDALERRFPAAPSGRFRSARLDRPPAGYLWRNVPGQD
jgi:DNA-binding transcriptional ArsR family regulator